MKQRHGHLLFFLGSTLVLALAYYVQYADHLNPCILCIMQRVCFFAVAATSLIAFIHHPRRWGDRVYNALRLFFSSGGIYYAGRQVWLQHLPPDQASACPPSIKFLFENFPLSDALNVLFYGSGDCAVVTWRLLGFSMAVWSLLIFILLFLSAFYFLIRSIKG